MIGKYTPLLTLNLTPMTLAFKDGEVPPQRAFKLVPDTSGIQTIWNVYDEDGIRIGHSTDLDGACSLALRCTEEDIKRRIDLDELLERSPLPFPDLDALKVYARECGRYLVAGQDEFNAYMSGR